MTVSINIPNEVEAVLRQAFGDHLDRAFVEAVAADGYRSGKLSRGEVQALLGFDDRWQTESWLAEKGIRLNYDIAELEADRRTAEELFSKKP